MIGAIVLGTVFLVVVVLVLINRGSKTVKHTPATKQTKDDRTAPKHVVIQKRKPASERKRNMKHKKKRAANEDPLRVPIAGTSHGYSMETSESPITSPVAAFDVDGCDTEIQEPAKETKEEMVEELAGPTFFEMAYGKVTPYRKISREPLRSTVEDAQNECPQQRTSSINSMVPSSISTEDDDPEKWWPRFDRTSNGYGHEATDTDPPRAPASAEVLSNWGNEILRRSSEGLWRVSDEQTIGADHYRIPGTPPRGNIKNSTSGIHQVCTALLKPAELAKANEDSNKWWGTESVDQSYNAPQSWMHRGKGCPIDWNGEFQRYLEMPETTVTEKLLKYNAISVLASDFVHTAKTFGKIIISERRLPDQHRTILPDVSIGGVAGGEKYIYHGILFKFAESRSDIYGGPENAQRAAGHELKGAMRYYQCPGLHVPLMALIDYRGHRLVAQSILPITTNTLQYGSKDAGLTVKNTNAHLSSLMKSAGEIMNLKPHLAGLKKKIMIYGPTDIEGHLGTDNRFYVIDFGRVFPPTFEPDVAQSFMYKLFRPEFVKSYHRPLSSDAFSQFGNPDNMKEHNHEIKEATHHLFNSVIPEFAHHLSTQPVEKHAAELTELLHRQGINMRYLGKVRDQITNPDWRRAILTEMCGRIIKNRLRQRLRENDQTSTCLMEDLFRKVVIDFLNVILGHEDDCNYFIPPSRNLVGRSPLHPSKSSISENTVYGYRDSSSIVLQPLARTSPAPANGIEYQATEKEESKYPLYIPSGGNPSTIYAAKELIRSSSSLSSRDFWLTDMKNLLIEYFQSGLVVEETAPGFDLRSALNMPLLFKRIQHLTGVKLTKSALRELNRSGGQFKIVLSDVKKISAKVKHMNIVSLAEANALSIKAISGHQSSNRLFRLAMLKFETAIRSTPDNLAILNNYAEQLVQYGLREDVNDCLEYFQKAAEKLRMSGNFQDLVKLGGKLQNLHISRWQQEEELLKLSLQCYRVAMAHSMPEKEKFRLYLATGNTLRQLAQRSGDTKQYEDAGRMYQSALQIMETKSEQEVREEPYNKWASLLPWAAGLWVNELALLFELCSKSPDLTVFDINHLFRRSLFTGSFLGKLCRYGSLKVLKLPHCSFISNKDLLMIKYCSKIESLDLRGHCHLDDQHLCGIVEKKTALRKLRISHCTRITEASIGYVAKECPAISSIDINDCVNISDEMFAEINWNRNGITRFYRANCDKSTPDGFKSLIINQPELKVIDFSGSTVVTNSVMHTIASRATKLEDLRIRSCIYVNDEMVAAVVRACPNLTALDIAGCTNNNSQQFTHTLAALSVHANVKRLSLAGLPNLHGTVLQALCPIAHRLQDLDLSDCGRIPSSTLCKIFDPARKIRSLNLNRCPQVDDNVLKSIRSTYLQNLDLGMVNVPCRITDEGIIDLVQSCTSLVSLSVCGHKEIAAQSLEAIGVHCPNLKRLLLSQCRYVTDDGLKALADGCHKIEVLDLSQCQLISSLGFLTHMCPLLKEINLSNCDNIQDETVASFANLKLLRELDVFGCKRVTDTGIQDLAAGAPSLEVLVQGNNKISEDGIGDFRKARAQVEVRRKAVGGNPVAWGRSTSGKKSFSRR